VKRASIDINCDMGEGFGQWRVGGIDDAAIMRLISSANIATGFHAGDPNLMDHTVRLAAEHGVAIGAHPGYKDLQGFGRRKLHGTDAEIINDIAYQVGALREFCRRYGVDLRHVKLHGALYMELAANATLSEAYLGFLQETSPDAFVFCMDVSETCRVAKVIGQPFVREFYADRDYAGSGSIVFTRRVDALDPVKVADKVLRACVEGRVRTVDGEDIDIAFESICFHSDTPGCLEIAEAMRTALVSNGIRIAPPSGVTAPRLVERAIP